MIELYYKLDYDGIGLYELKNGKGEYITKVRDREDLLLYIEENYKCVKLIIGIG